MSLGKLERSWLTLLREDEYRAAVPSATGCASDAAALPSDDPPDTGAPRQGIPIDVFGHPTSLSEDFDPRAQALLASLRTVAAR